MTAFAVEVTLLLVLVFLVALAVGYRIGRRRGPSASVPVAVPEPAALVEPPKVPLAAPQPSAPPQEEPVPSPQQDLFARLGITDMNAVPPLDEEDDEPPRREEPSPSRAQSRTRRRDPEKLPGVRPAALSAPEGDGPDDLKQLKGIGPQNEQRLNEIGIFHLRQIAAWTPEEAAWVGSYLAFPGRIEREDWMGQAKAILEGAPPPPRKRR